MEERLMPVRDFISNNLMCPNCYSSIGFKRKEGGWRYYPSISRRDWHCKYCDQALAYGKD